MIEVGLIGCGGIAHDLVESINRLAPPRPLSIVASFARPQGPDSRRQSLGGIELASSLAALLDRRPRIVAEVASQAAVRDYGPTVLRSGADLLVVSTGALADAATYSSLKTAAHDGHSRLMIPAGAIGGLDVVGALRLGGLSQVVYRSVKPPRAWKGTHAEQLICLDDLATPTVFFAGTAREAALTFPQNANVAATIALAGVGFDWTRVELVADPDRSTNQHQILAEGAVGRVSLTVESQPSRVNPKTSALTAFSVVRALLNEAEAVVI
jgi:aspartate dehydrogenase